MLKNGTHSLTFLPITDIDTCVSLTEASACYVVNSNITINHHPYLFTEESVNLIVIDASHAFLNGRKNVMYNGRIPTQVTAKIIVTLVGVEFPRNMTKEEIDIFEASLLQFFNNELLSENEKYPAILVEVVVVESQMLVEDYESIVESNESKMEESDINVLEVTVSVDGVYLPPPNITFDEVLVDTLDEEGDDEFIDILNKNALAENETFFIDVASASSRKVDDDKDDDKDDGGIGEIVIGLLVGSIGFVAILTFIQFIRHANRRHRAAKLEEYLRREYGNRSNN